MSKLRYLHISDLHLKVSESGKKDPGSNDSGKNIPATNQVVVTDTLLKKIDDLVGTSDVKFDLVFITGDVVFSGNFEEYEYVAKPFIKRLLEIVKLPPQMLFMIPGNHDVNRSNLKEQHFRWFHNFNNAEEITQSLIDRFSSECLREKFLNFNAFVNSLADREVYGEDNYHYVDEVRLKISGKEYRVNIVGLNSSIFAGYNGDDFRRLALGLPQVHRAVMQLSKESLFNIFLMHHPFVCFHEADKDSQKQIMAKADIVLSGHLHDPENNMIKHSRGSTVCISAGAAYDHPERLNSFNQVQIDLNTGDGEVRFYDYDKGSNSWESSIRPNRNECFEFRIDKIAKREIDKIDLPNVNERGIIKYKSNTERTIKFFNYPLESLNFEERDEYFSRLREIINGNNDPETNNIASVVAITAVGGVGKTSLMLNAAQRLKVETHYEHILWYSFSEEMISDEIYFFRNVLQYFKGEEIVSNSSSVKELCDELVRLVETVPVLFLLDSIQTIQEDPNLLDDNSRYGFIKKSHSEINRLILSICSMQHTSKIIITSRIGLKEYAGSKGYVEIPLELFSPSMGAKILRSIGVKGNDVELENCSKVFGGHALLLIIAGREMTERMLSASETEKLIGDLDIFKVHPEANRLASILNSIREGLSYHQVRFLKLMCINPKPVTESNFILLVENYNIGDINRDWVYKNIIAPLKRRSLIEVKKNSIGESVFLAHPLLNVAYSTWLEKSEKIESNELWANMLINSLDLTKLGKSNSLDELQIGLDAITAYINAENYQNAWDIFYSKHKIYLYLDRLNYGKIQLDFALRFEKIYDIRLLNLSTFDVLCLYDIISRAYIKLDKNGDRLIYEKKSYKFALSSENPFFIQESRDFLATSFLQRGQINEASSLGYLTSKAKSDLEFYSGNYKIAVKLYQDNYDRGDGHDKTVLGSRLGRALTKLGLFYDAKRVLIESYSIAEKSNFRCCMKDHLKYLILLEIKLGDFIAAFDYEIELVNLSKNWRESPPIILQLMFVKKDFDGILKFVDESFAKIDDSCPDYQEQIFNYLMLSKVLLERKDIESAVFYLNAAYLIAIESKCWCDKDVFIELIQLTGCSLAIPFLE